MNLIKGFKKGYSGNKWSNQVVTAKGGVSASLCCYNLI